MKNVNKFYYSYSKKHFSKVFFYFFLNILNILLEILGLTAFLFLISFLLNTDNDINFLSIYIPKENYFFILIISILVIYSLKLIFHIFYLYYEKKIQIIMNESLFLELMQKYLFIDYERSSKDNSIIKLRYLTGEIPSAVSYILGHLIITAETLYVFGILIFLLSKYFLITIFVLVALIFFSVVYYYLFKKKIISYSKSIILNDNELHKKIVQSIHGLNEIKIYNLEKYFFEKTSKLLEINNKLRLTISLITSIPRYYFEFIILLIIVSIIFILKSVIGYENNQITEILAVLSICLLRSLPSFSKILSGFQNINNLKASAIVIMKQLEESSNNYFLEKRVNKEENNNFKKIELIDVFYKYDELEKYVLENINLKIQSGELIGIYGATGSGKSTLINILCGLIKPTTGDYKINSSLADRVPKDLFSIVPQKPLIIDGSIKANIAFGVEDSDVDESRLYKVLEKCELKSFVDKLPNGVNTIISENGKNISGGQSQRLAIARAIYLKKKILIMDEATNSLDEKTEKSILNFILNLKNELTIIMISHNMENLNSCDKIYKISDKKLQEGSLN
jgi:ATP-binding cassette, subfamily B, bacterial PglK